MSSVTEVLPAASEKSKGGSKTNYYLHYSKLVMINRGLERTIREETSIRDDLLKKIAEVAGRDAGSRGVTRQIQEKNQREVEAQRLRASEQQQPLDSPSGSEDEAREKKRRRKRDEIKREFECPVEGCGKAYG